MSNIDWDMLITSEMKGAQTSKALEAAYSEKEALWQESEMLVIAEQLLAIEDDDPIALSGTERQWRDYRIQVRAWKEGAEGFPESERRPVRPS